MRRGKLMANLETSQTDPQSVVALITGITSQDQNGLSDG